MTKILFKADNKRVFFSRITYLVPLKFQTLIEYCNYFVNTLNLIPVNYTPYRFELPWNIFCQYG